jgi:hypothetical protein
MQSNISPVVTEKARRLVYYREASSAATLIILYKWNMYDSSALSTKDVIFLIWIDQFKLEENS